jgi:hypothetical protein
MYDETAVRLALWISRQIEKEQMMVCPDTKEQEEEREEECKRQWLEEIVDPGLRSRVEKVLSLGTIEPFIRFPAKS